MAISYKFWGELHDEIKPYVSRFNKGEITMREFLDIVDQKYNEFVQKYDN